MRALFNWYFNSIDPEQVNKFVRAASDFIFVRMNVSGKEITSFKSYYNGRIQSCIVKLVISREFHVDHNNLIYFMVNSKEEDVTLYGERFENGLHDTERNIKWIYKGELLVFWPDQTITKRLNSRLVT